MLAVVFVLVIILEVLYGMSQIILNVSRYRRTTHVTPKSYLSFLAGYKTIYAAKKDEIGELGNRMNTGLEKLIEASQTITVLQTELEEKKKDLAVASAEAEEVLKEVKQRFQIVLCTFICFMKCGERTKPA